MSFLVPLGANLLSFFFMIRDFLKRCMLKLNYETTLFSYIESVEWESIKETTLKHFMTLTLYITTT